MERQKPVPLLYKTLRFEEGDRLDLLVADQVIIELKCVDSLLPIHEAQLISYLKLTGLQVGLLVNFKVPLLKKGIKRFVN